MSLQFNIEQIDELIKRDYRVPRFAELSINTDPNLFPEHISMKDLLVPLLKDYSLAKKREAYLIDCLKFMLSYGGGSVFWHRTNPERQKFVDDIAQAIPEVKWPEFYKPKQEDKAMSDP